MRAMYSSSVKFYARITILLLFGICIGTTQGLLCYICGQYNDGVGSITPCINYTAQMHLNVCPSSPSWCIDTSHKPPVCRQPNKRNVPQIACIQASYGTRPQKCPYPMFKGRNKKYVSEGSIVRDCVPECHEKESWSTKTYCCQEDGCNSAPGLASSSVAMCAFASLLALLLQQGSNLRG